MLRSIGRATLDELGRVWQFATLAVLTLRAVVERPREGWRLVAQITARQIVFTAIESLPLSVFVGAAFGVAAVVTLDALVPGVYASPEFQRVGMFVLLRNLSPFAAALLVILRSSSAIAIELGYMTAQGEVEGIETSGMDPIKVLLVPRFVATVLATGVLTVVVAASVMGGAYMTGVVRGQTPLSWSMVRYAWHQTALTDLLVGVIKAVLTGAAIASIASYYGLSVGRDITRVPRHATRALVDSLVAYVVIGVAITVASLG